MSTHSCWAVSHTVFLQTLTKLVKKDPSQTFKTPNPQGETRLTNITP